MRQAVRSERGMTLVEVMVSAVVLSMVMLALSASLRTFATTYSAVERISEQSARVREVTYFLRHAIREADFPYAGALEASSSEITWRAPLDRVGAAGGVVHLRLRRSSDKLMLDFAIPAEDDAENEGEGDLAWGDVIRSEVLLEGLSQFAVEVMAASGEEWDANFGDASAGLPAAVKLSFELTDQIWPPIVIALDGHQEPM